MSKGRFITRTIGGETYRCYMPHDLPVPIDTDAFRALTEKAMVAIGRLDGISTLLPDVSLYLYTYICKEAVLSSQIEGTQSTLSDILLFESKQNPGVPLADVNEVVCYIDAVTYALERAKELPLSLRLIREIHARLLNNPRGQEKQPGEFRTTQNWVGGSRPGNALYVPPPPQQRQLIDSSAEGQCIRQRQRKGVVLIDIHPVHRLVDDLGRIQLRIAHNAINQ